MACYMCDGRAAVITTPRVGSIKYGGEPVKGAAFRQTCLVCRSHQPTSALAIEEIDRRTDTHLAAIQASALS